MKRTVAMMAGALTLGVTLYVGTRLAAQPPAGGDRVGGAATPVTSRLRLVNLSHIIKNYKRMEVLRVEHKKLFEQYDKQLKQLKDTSDKWQEYLTKNAATLDQAKKDEAEKTIKKIQREMADRSDEARNALMKKEGELVTLVYKEIEDAVRKYAESQSIELVLHYNDVVAETERYSAMNINRKMTAGACMPMYIAAGLDISDDIVKVLNQNYPGSASAPPAAPSGGQ